MKTSAKIKTILFAASSAAILINSSALAQLTVDTTYTPQQLVNNVLLGTGVTATNITCNCTPGAYAFFDGNASNLGIPGGVLLTTGRARIAIGPNNSPSAGVDNGVMYRDSQLTSFDSVAIYDPCILEFDFVPDSNHIQFKYAFGSEEYNEWDTTRFNDAFGFFLQGPGILNPNNNIALIPGTTTPITIDSVNDGYSAAYVHSTGPCHHCQYFYDNLSGTSIQYDGFTTVLTAQAIVTAGSTYHIKLIIADGSDGIYDSGVFLQCGSFSSCEGCNNSACSVLTSDADKLAENNVSVYPNPVSDLLTISFHADGNNAQQAIITDITGRQLYSQTLDEKKEHQISTRNLKDGIYLLQIRGTEQTVNKKFIVAHN